MLLKKKGKSNSQQLGKVVKVKEEKKNWRKQLRTPTPHNTQNRGIKIFFTRWIQPANFFSFQYSRITIASGERNKTLEKAYFAEIVCQFNTSYLL